MGGTWVSKRPHGSSAPARSDRLAFSVTGIDFRCVKPLGFWDYLLRRRAAPVLNHPTAASSPAQSQQVHADSGKGAPSPGLPCRLTLHVSPRMLSPQNNGRSVSSSRFWQRRQTARTGTSDDVPRAGSLCGGTHLFPKAASCCRGHWKSRPFTPMRNPPSTQTRSTRATVAEF